MPSDFDQIAANPPGEAPIPELENLRQALSGMREFQSKLAVQSQMNEQVQPPGSIQVNTAKNTVTLKDLPVQTYEAYNRDRQQLNEIRGAFAQEAERLQVRERQVQGQPWMQLATALSANLAQAKDMPGWVQAAGRTAAQLNPTADELRNQRLAVLGKEAEITEKAGGLDIAAARTRQDQIRESRLARMSFQAEHVNAAIRGEGDPASTTALGVQMGVIPPEQAEAFQKNLEGLKKSYEEKQTKAEQAKMAHDIQITVAKAGVEAEKQAKVFAQQDKLLERRLSAMSAENEKKAAVAETKGAAKKTDLKDFETKELEQYVAADKALDEVEALLKTPAAQKAMGPYSGRIASLGAKVAPAFADPDGTIRGMISKLKLQTAQAIKSTGAGARGFGPMERPFFENLAEGITNTPEQNQKIIATWRQYLDQNRKGVLANHTDDTVQKYPKMFGPRLAGETGVAPAADDPLGIRR